MVAGVGAGQVAEGGVVGRGGVLCGVEVAVPGGNGIKIGLPGKSILRD